MGLRRVMRKGIAGAALVALATACSHSGDLVQEHGSPAVARPAGSRPGRAVVAMPTLLGLSVDDLARYLGPPQPMPGALQALLSQMPSPAPTDSLLFFRYRHLDVLVSYDAHTRRFNDLLLLGSSEELLMQRAGLSADAVNYLLLPVFHAHRPLQQLGLRVVPIAPLQLQ